MSKPKMRIIFEMSGKEPKVVECDGIAFIATMDRDNHHHDTCGIVGSLGLGDLIHLHEAVKNNLLPEIKAHAVEGIVEAMGD